MGKMIGIDLGTTFSVAAIVDGPRSRVLDNRESKPLTRSVVSVRRGFGADSDELLVGEVAYDNALDAPADTIVSVKRLVGRAFSDTEVQTLKRKVDYLIAPSEDGSDGVRVVMNGRLYSPVEISAEILKKVKADAEYRLGGGAQVTHAVVTVPAYFSAVQKQATREAAWQAGLRIIKILDEPTAAAIAFGMADREVDESGARNILVFDLGGGTFDVSVLTMGGGTFVQNALAGDMWLGGDDFDQKLVDRVKKECADRPDLESGEPNAIFDFVARDKARTAKETLTSSEKARILIPSLVTDKNGRLVNVSLDVTRKEFEGMIAIDVARMVGKVEEALSKANLTRDEIDFVLMAGGSTAIPLVQKAMEDLFGPDKVVRDLHPKHCVAHGAAIVAKYFGERMVCQTPKAEDPTQECGTVNDGEALNCQACRAPLFRSGLVLDSPNGPGIREIVEVSPFYYGVRTPGEGFTVIIKPGDPVPTATPYPEIELATSIDDQRMCSISVYNSEHERPGSASLMNRQGQAFVVLPPGSKKGTVVIVRLWLDREGMFQELKAFLRDTGAELAPWIVRPGESEEYVVRQLEETEEIFGEKAARLSPPEKSRLEKLRHEAFSLVTKSRLDEAKRAIENYRREVEAAGGAPGEVGPGAGGTTPPDPLITSAETLTGFGGFLVREFGWALPPDRAYALNKLIEEVKTAVRRDDRAFLAEKVPELEASVTVMPRIVGELTEMHMLLAVLWDRNPGRCVNRREEFEEIMKKARRGEDVTSALEVLKRKVEQDIEDFQPPAPPACPNCGLPVPGRYCRRDGFDMWQLVLARAGYGDSISRR